MFFIDGCTSEITNGLFSWPESNLGTSVNLNCSCANLSLGVGQPIATRTCSGNFTNGAMWILPNTSTCERFINQTQLLCSTTQVQLQNMY